MYIKIKIGGVNIVYCVHTCSVSVVAVVPTCSFEFSLRFILTEVLKVLAAKLLILGTCLLHSFKVYLGAYPGVSALHSSCQNSYLGAYPGVRDTTSITILTALIIIGQSHTHFKVSKLQCNRDCYLCDA